MPGHLPSYNIGMFASVLESPRVVSTKGIGLHKTNHKADSVLLGFEDWGYSVHNLTALGQNAVASVIVRLSLNVLLRKTFLCEFLRSFLASKIFPEDFKLTTDHVLDI